MEKKMTKKEVFAMLLSVEGVKGNPMFEEFIEHELELLDKKAGSKKLSEKEIAKKSENEELKAVILEVLTNNGSCSIAEMKAKDEKLFPLSSSKISSLLVQLRADSLVTREYEKKVAIFSIA